MTMPHSPGWYDDPDGSGAERYFNGQDWGPERRRKSSAPRRSPPAPDPYAPPPTQPVDPYATAYPHTGSSPPGAPADGYGTSYPSTSFGPTGFQDPYASGYPYPAGPADPYGTIPAAAPIDPYAAGSPYGAGSASYGPADPYGAGTASAAAAPYGPVAHVGPPQQPPLSRLKAGMALGADRVVGIVTAASGVALVAASFWTWGRASWQFDMGDVVYGSKSVSFPGLGKPNMSVKLSGDGTTVNGNVESPELNALHNTNPGWIALALGIVAIIAGIAYLWIRQRMPLAVAVAVLGAIAGVLCLSNTLDIAGTFGNPPGLARSDFSPGPGLVVACVLSFVLAGVGIVAAVSQRRAQAGHPGYGSAFR